MIPDCPKRCVKTGWSILSNISEHYMCTLFRNTPGGALKWEKGRNELPSLCRSLYPMPESRNGSRCTLMAEAVKDNIGNCVQSVTCRDTNSSHCRSHSKETHRVPVDCDSLMTRFIALCSHSQRKGKKNVKNIISEEIRYVFLAKAFSNCGTDVYDKKPNSCRMYFTKFKSFITWRIMVIMIFHDEERPNL